MSSQADIRRAAAACLPFRLGAIRALEGLARHTTRSIDVDSLLDRLVGSNMTRLDKRRFRSLLEEHGILRPTVDGTEVLWTGENVSQLRWTLEGAILGLDSISTFDRPVSVITLPNDGYDISESLERRGVERATLGRTIDAFAAVARAATEKFIVATPFIDAAGVDVFNTIAAAVDPSVKSYLIVRKYEDILRAEQSGGDRKVAQNVSIMTYYRDRPGRSRETFHGKYFVADESVAYIGSANLLYASLESTVESGVLLRGVDAKPLSVFAQAMLESSTLVRLPA